MPAAGPSIQGKPDGEGQSSTYETRDTLEQTNGEDLFDDTTLARRSPWWIPHPKNHALGLSP
jgi:hypothetical protein